VTRRRSTLRALVCTASVLIISSCATFSSDAARVGDVSLDGGDFQEMLADLAEKPEFADLLVGERSVDAEFARNLLSEWITGQVLAHDLADRGIAIGDDVSQTVERQLASGNGPLWEQVPPALRALLVESTAARQVFENSLAPDPEVFRAAYEQGIAASGFACTRHILVATEEEAAEVVAELEAGADFAQVAAVRSTDSGSATNGGIIEPAPGEACFDAGTFAQSLVPEFVEAAFAATVGVPTAPVQSQFGWHVILVRPFDEVAQVVAQSSSGAEVEAAARVLVDTADVHVASKYGRFDRQAGAVVPLGG